MHTGVHVCIRPGHEERGRELLTAARGKLYTGDLPDLPDATEFWLGREAPTIGEAYREVVTTLNAIDRTWSDALDVASPPEAAQ